MRRVLIVLVLLGAVLSLSGSAYAWNMLQTNTYWLQNTADTTGASAFDRIDLQWLSGSQFASPAMLNYGSSLSAWSVSGTSTAAAATIGSAQTYVDMNFNFLGDSPSATELLYSVSLNGILVNMQRVWYPQDSTSDVNGWNCEYLSQDEFNRLASTAAVPEPATMALLGMGVLGLAGLRRKS